MNPSGITKRSRAGTGTRRATSRIQKYPGSPHTRHYSDTFESAGPKLPQPSGDIGDTIVVSCGQVQSTIPPQSGFSPADTFSSTYLFSTPYEDMGLSDVYGEAGQSSNLDDNLLLPSLGDHSRDGYVHSPWPTDDIDRTESRVIEKVYTIEPSLTMMTSTAHVLSNDVNQHQGWDDIQSHMRRTEHLFASWRHDRSRAEKAEATLETMTEKDEISRQSAEEGEVRLKMMMDEIRELQTRAEEAEAKLKTMADENGQLRKRAEENELQCRTLEARLEKSEETSNRALRILQGTLT
ncbi:hypothetical protein LTR96_011853 [Exophiala xenobiotica]|nr:hypothetical protein LTR96_011853 [Exophiala xenobiotica]